MCDEKDSKPARDESNQEGEEMKKLDGRTKAGRAAELKASLKKMSSMPLWPRSRIFGDELVATQAAMDSTLRGMMGSVDIILQERESRYGNFADHAGITQRLKQTMYCCPKYSDLQDDQSEALEMIAHKIGRILNGDPNCADSWVDIAGYAKLVADRLEKEQK